MPNRTPRWGALATTAALVVLAAGCNTPKETPEPKSETPAEAETQAADTPSPDEVAEARQQAAAAGKRVLDLKPGQPQAPETTEAAHKPSAKKESHLPAVERPDLGEAKALEGAGVKIALPKGAKRAGRQLMYEVPGNPPVVVAVSHAHSPTDAYTAADRGAAVFMAKKEFEADGDPWELTDKPQRVAVYGKLFRDPLRNDRENYQGLIVTRHQSERLLFLRVGFPESQRGLAEGIGASIDLLPQEKLDPLKIHGIELTVEDGYKIRQDMLHPIVVQPNDANGFVEGKPSIDIRVSTPGHGDELLNEMFQIFKADVNDPNSVKCTKGKDQHGQQRQTCSFASGRGSYGVQLDYIEDELGGVVVIMTRPEVEKWQVHFAPFEKMVKSLRLVPPADLLSAEEEPPPATP